MIRALALSLMLLCGSAHAGGAKCNNTASQIVVNGAIYLPLDGGPLTEVTLCKKATS